MQPQKRPLKRKAPMAASRPASGQGESLHTAAISATAGPAYRILALPLMGTPAMTGEIP